MRIAVLADVHGNLPALEAVLSEIDRTGLDGIVVAGDLTAGPHSSQATELLADRGALMILGNSDINLLRLIDGQAPEAWYTSRQFALLRWNARHLSPRALEILRSLPDQTAVHLPGTDPLRVVHGSPGDPYEELYPDQAIDERREIDPGSPGSLLHAGTPRSSEGLRRAMSHVSEPVLICGHTHEPWVSRMDGRLALNPGSVAGPLNGVAAAQYAQLEWEQGTWRPELREVPYDLSRIRQAFVESGLLDEGGPLARAFLASIETGLNVAKDLLDHAYRLAAEAGYPGCRVVPDEIWVRTAAEFPWSAYQTLE